MSDSVLDLTGGYMEEVHDPTELVRRVRHLTKGLEFDTLVGVGLSGSLAVPELARRLGVHYLVIRKAGDGSHSWTPAEGKLGRRWLFVDDLIASGRTFARVWDVVHQLCDSHHHSTEFVGGVMYHDYTFYPAGHGILKTGYQYSEWERKKRDKERARKERERLEAERLDEAKRQAEDPILAGFTKTGTTEDGGEVWTRPYVEGYPNVTYYTYPDAAGGIPVPKVRSDEEIEKIRERALEQVYGKPLTPTGRFVLNPVPENMQGKYNPGTPEYYERVQTTLSDLRFTAESKARFSERYGLTKTEDEPATV